MLTDCHFTFQNEIPIYSCPDSKTRVSKFAMCTVVKFHESEDTCGNSSTMSFYPNFTVLINKA